jgi:hypothetical protein
VEFWVQRVVIWLSFLSSFKALIDKRSLSYVIPC